MYPRTVLKSVMQGNLRPSSCKKTVQTFPGCLPQFITSDTECTPSSRFRRGLSTLSTAFLSWSQIHVSRNFTSITKKRPLDCPKACDFHTDTCGLPNRLNSSRSSSNTQTSFSEKINAGPELNHFMDKVMMKSAPIVQELHDSADVPYIAESLIYGSGRKVYFDVYGCQMNVNDAETAWGILQNSGFKKTTDITESDVILVITCSVRERAEEKIWNRLKYLAHLKKRRKYESRAKPPLKVALLGCMAERLKQQILEKDKSVDVICGPDAYRDLPRMLAVTETGQPAINVLLSLEETYADIMPVRLDAASNSAFVSIMRGCDNMCTYCIVPFTRGRERSRPMQSILEEIRVLSEQGVKEVTLLGQNVNSYRDTSEVKAHGGLGDVQMPTAVAQGFSTVYKPKVGGRRFADLLDKVSLINPDMRIRFTSPHPKDFPDEVLQLIGERSNICNHIHLPAQSGSSAVLERMRRGYSRQAYLDLVFHIRELLPDVSLTSDFIAGFCGETEEEHEETVSLLRQVKYNFAFCFPYSLRQKTPAHRRLEDDVPQEVKDRRHMELISVFRQEALELNTQQIGREHLVLIEGRSKKSVDDLSGRSESNLKVIVPDVKVTNKNGSTEWEILEPGDYVSVKIMGATSQTLRGVPLYRTTVSEFYNRHRSSCAEPL